MPCNYGKIFVAFLRYTQPLISQANMGEHLFENQESQQSGETPFSDVYNIWAGNPQYLVHAWIFVTLLST